MLATTEPLFDQLITGSERFKRQTREKITYLDDFNRRIQAAHFQTLATPPTILHWNFKTCDLSPWKWPAESGTGRRVTPSDLEGHRRTHQFRAPSCLCAFLDRKLYTESSIGVVHVPMELSKSSSLNGEYTAECATGRCGYLERFYILPVLHMRGYPKRDNPCSPRPFTYNSTQNFLKGLQQVFPTRIVDIRGIKRVRREAQEPCSSGPTPYEVAGLIEEGVSEDALYQLLIQCYLCKAVVLRSSFPGSHRCLRKCKYQWPGAREGSSEAVQEGNTFDGENPTDVDTDTDVDSVTEHSLTDAE
ncbi:hypothetical protein BKA70DRAFT_1417051 [Coprinopsis sp. MPI-PUGE-AT-0042]|nr:hypothetical protein BKA70DRAFT_1417051 [Coprinopsis sp. MPI-PUGE-AT-0042]